MSARWFDIHIDLENAISCFYLRVGRSKEFGIEISIVIRFRRGAAFHQIVDDFGDGQFLL